MDDAVPQLNKRPVAEEIKPSDVVSGRTHPPAENATPRELAEQLRASLRNLHKFVVLPYRDQSSLELWPSRKALEHAMTLVEALGRAIGIKKIEIGCLDGVVRRIDLRYPKLGLIAFVDALVRKIASVPLGPLTRIEKALAGSNDAQKTDQLIAIRDLLKSPDWELKVKASTWRELGPLLLELSSGLVKEGIAKAKPATMQDIDFYNSKKLFDGAFGLAAFLELQRQHLLWRLKWDHKVLPVAQWIYILQNPTWDDQLRQVLIMRDMTPAEFEKKIKSDKETLKKRRYRKKNFSQ